MVESLVVTEIVMTGADERVSAVMDALGRLDADERTLVSNEGRLLGESG